MRIYIIGNDGITLCREPPAAVNEGEIIVASSGTTSGGGANLSGTVFEIAKTSSGYAGTLATLVSFNSSNGYGPYAGLITDPAATSSARQPTCKTAVSAMPASVPTARRLTLSLSSCAPQAVRRFTGRK